MWGVQSIKISGQFSVMEGQFAISLAHGFLPLSAESGVRLRGIKDLEKRSVHHDETDHGDEGCEDVWTFARNEGL
jgi:hypothetical protein